MKRINIIFAVMAVFVLSVSAAFAAPGDTTQNTPSLSSYETPVYADPVVDADGNHTLTVTNTYHPEVINVTVTKIWDDDNNRDNLRPTQICATLTASANGGSARGEVHNHTLSVSDVDATDSNKWTYTFEDLVKYYDGYQIAYTVAESDGACSAITYTAANCELSGGKWENSTCTPVTRTSSSSGGGSNNPVAPQPSDYTDEASCTAANFTWDAANSQCVE